ncbi:AAA family ATPase [Thermococcus aciditolerans]|uniref:ATP-binding protein n=1 Tax=Thermococcus aciditolerans TaxID=2598455 RepID=A0A5C0SRD7_9EURY|nr:AAA family ATPase [Thermococcus aciditolerans]QEK15459.1 ATP-binding protein [Thermococcus aciditolerans]
MIPVTRCNYIDAEILPSECLFGRDKELKELNTKIKNNRWTVVSGKRLVGKTTLTKTAASESGRPFIYIDLSTVAKQSTAKNIATMDALLIQLIREAKRRNLIDWDKLKNETESHWKAQLFLNVLHSNIEYSKTKGADLKSLNLYEVFTALKSDTPPIIILDEIQLLGVEIYALASQLRGAFQQQKPKERPMVILTGSTMSITKLFSNPEEYGYEWIFDNEGYHSKPNPWFGRNWPEIFLKPLNHDEHGNEMAMGLLSKCLEESDKKGCLKSWIMKEVIQQSLGLPGVIVNFCANVSPGCENVEKIIQITRNITRGALLMELRDLGYSAYILARAKKDFRLSIRELSERLAKAYRGMAQKGTFSKRNVRTWLNEDKVLTGMVLKVLLDSGVIKEKHGKFIFAHDAYRDAARVIRVAFPDFVFSR